MPIQEPSAKDFVPEWLRPPELSSNHGLKCAIGLAEIMQKCDPDQNTVEFLIVDAGNRKSSQCIDPLLGGEDFHHPHNITQVTRQRFMRGRPIWELRTLRQKSEEGIAHSVSSRGGTNTPHPKRRRPPSPNS